MRSLMFSGFGMFVGLFFCPQVRPPYEPGDEIRYMIVGAFLGWLLGSLLNKRTCDIANETQDADTGDSI